MTDAQILQGQLLAALLLYAVDAGTVLAADDGHAWLFERGLDKVPRRVTDHMAALVDAGWAVAVRPRYELTGPGRLALPTLLS